EELARAPDERKLIELVTSGTHLGRPMATTPDVPADRLAALRDAYRATMTDPEFRAEAEKAGFEVAPVYGEEMQKIVERIMSTPKELARRPKHLVGGAGAAVSRPHPAPPADSSDGRTITNGDDAATNAGGATPNAGDAANTNGDAATARARHGPALREDRRF